MLNIAVLVSGGGTNLQALLDSEARGENPNGKITLVVASKPGVYALERAAKAGVEGVVVRRKDYAASEDFDAALLAVLEGARHRPGGAGGLSVRAGPQRHRGLSAPHPERPPRPHPVVLRARHVRPAPPRGRAGPGRAR